MARPVGDPARGDGAVQGAEQAQRIDVPVERTVARAHHLGPDVGQHAGNLGMAEDLGPVVDDAGLVEEVVVGGRRRDAGVRGGREDERGDGRAEQHDTSL